MLRISKYLFILAWLLLAGFLLLAVFSGLNAIHFR
jgi:hypothetical protein